LEQKFHDYFYNGELEHRLSYLTSWRQKYTESISDYLRQFREVRNRCYNLTIAEKDLADLAFVGMTLYLRDKLEGQEFSDTNQLLQRAMPYENHAKSSWFWDNANKDKEKHHVHYVDHEVEDEEGNEICVAEWVEKPRDKPISCSFLKPNGGRRDEVEYTFDVSKCDLLFDLLLWGGVIWLTEGHVIPNADVLPKKTYCKWHNSYTHTTNECNYFRWQVQSAINDGRSTLGDGGKMKLDTDPFPIDMVEFELCTFLGGIFIFFYWVLIASIFLKLFAHMLLELISESSLYLVYLVDSNILISLFCFVINYQKGGDWSI
jgi:hypothetical protein